MALGIDNVDAMLRRNTAKQLRNWELFYELEPFGETRDDYRFASIVQVIANVLGRGKDQKAYTLEECMVKFGERERAHTQTLEQQKAMWRSFAHSLGKKE